MIKKTKRKKRTIKKPVRIFKNARDECDFYWKVLVKARAGFKSELSENYDDLHPRHLRGKPNYALRYSLLNGFCCTGGEHKFGFHHTGRQADFENRVKAIRGEKIFESLEMLTHTKETEPIAEIRDLLLFDLLPFYDDIKSWYHNKDYKNHTIKKQYEYLFGLLKLKLEG